MTGKDKIIYGAGAFGYGAVNQTFGNFLMFFGTAVLGLSGTLMGLAISVSTVWDAVTDPIVGNLSDNCRCRFGKRQIFMLIGCICIAIINVAIWSIPAAWGKYTKFFALLLTLLAVETFNTVYSTPYSALGIDMAKTYDERTSIQGYKTAFQFLSLLVPSLLITLGYIWVSVVTSCLCVITGCITVFGTKRNSEAINTSPGRSPIKNKNRLIFGNFFGFLKNKNTAMLIIAYTISLSCGAFITTLGMHIFTYTFHFSSLQIPIIMVGLIIGVVVGQPLWYKVSRHIDKKSTVLTAIATVLFGIVLFSVLLAFRGFLSQYIMLILVSFVIIITSCGVGCLYSMPISMFADSISCTEEDNTATAMGFLTLITKMANAFIMFIVGIALDVIGFRGGAVTQKPIVANLLGWVLIGSVVLSCVISWVFYEKYNDIGRNSL